MLLEVSWCMCDAMLVVCMFDDIKVASTPANVSEAWVSPLVSPLEEVAIHVDTRDVVPIGLRMRKVRLPDAISLAQPQKFAKRTERNQARVHASQLLGSVDFMPS